MRHIVCALFLLLQATNQFVRCLGIPAFKVHDYRTDAGCEIGGRQVGDAAAFGQEYAMYSEHLGSSE